MSKYVSSFDILGEKIKIKDVRLETALLNTRKYPFILSASTWFLGENNVPFTQEKRHETLDFYKSLGVDSIILILHLVWNGTTFDILETDDSVTDCINYSNQIKLRVDGVKIHCTKAEFDKSTETHSEYTNKVGYIFSLLGDYKPKYFCVYNEVYDTVLPYIDNMNETFTLINSKGITSVMAMTSVEIERMCSNIPSLNVQAIGLNYYQIFPTSPLKKSKYLAIEQCSNNPLSGLEKLSKRFEILITETGIRHYWDCFTNPADFTLGSVDGGGDVSINYLTGVFENQLIKGGCSSVWLWFAEQMDYQNTKDFIKGVTGKYE